VLQFIRRRTTFGGQTSSTLCAAAAQDARSTPALTPGMGYWSVLAPACCGAWGASTITPNLRGNGFPRLLPFRQLSALILDTAPRQPCHRTQRLRRTRRNPSCGFKGYPTRLTPRTGADLWDHWLPSHLDCQGLSRERLHRSRYNPISEKGPTFLRRFPRPPRW
jgi:hypothetical protein